MVARGIELGYEVWAGVRTTTSRKWLADPRIRFITFDFDDPAQIAAALRNALPEDEKWDYIIYNLGATKVIRYADFNRINYEYLRTFTGALHSSGRIPEKLLYMSSLSAVGASDDKGYEPYTEETIPHPDTRYGASKLKAELWLATAGIPYVIFRATGVYGPRDRDYFMMFDAISRGFDAGVGFRPQLLTFIYVDDLAMAAYMALEKAPAGEIYNISEPRAYTQRDFRKMAMDAMQRRFVLPVRFPIWAVGAVCAIAEKIGAARGKPSTLNRDKFRILRKRNWNCSVSKAERDFGFTAPTALADGIAGSIGWYKQEGWL